VPASWRGDDRRSTALSGAPLATHELRHWFEHYQKAGHLTRERLVDHPHLFLGALEDSIEQGLSEGLRNGARKGPAVVAVSTSIPASGFVQSSFRQSKIPFCARKGRIGPFVDPQSVASDSTVIHLRGGKT
jgi:hypothetical protein